MAVESRSLALIVGCFPQFPSDRPDCQPGDDTDCPADLEVTEDVVERAVLLATIKADPETLENILTWVRVNNIRSEKTQEPILFACLKNYSQCISILYSHGYRVKLQKIDSHYIPNLFKAGSVLRIKKSHEMFIERFQEDNSVLG